MYQPSEADGKRPGVHRKCPLCGQDNRRLPCSRYSRVGWRLKHCRQCGLLYLENAPPVVALAGEYSWRMSSRIENERRLRSRPVSGRVRALWKRWRRQWLPHRKAEALIRRYVVAGNLLDVGCGRGSLFVRLPGPIVPHGIEIDPAVIELAEARAAERGGRVVHADALRGLSMMAATEMSGIVMHSFLEHEIEPLVVLRESQRVLRSDGAIIIKVPNFACWNRRWQGKEWPGFRFPDHVNYFTPPTLSRLVLQAGLTILRFAWHDKLPSSDNMWLVAGRQQVGKLRV